MIIVDDGIATGSTARVAGQLARASGAVRVVLAVPAGPEGAVEELGEVADEVVCPMRIGDFPAVGEWYEDFRQISDQEAIELLGLASGTVQGPVVGGSASPSGR